MVGCPGRGHHGRHVRADLRPARVKKLAAIVLAVGALLAGALAFHAGTLLTRPVPRTIGAPPDATWEMVEIATGEGRTVRGWYGGGAAAQGAVLFLHGVREDRRTMLGRAELVREGGFSVLLIDLQAHGESAGERATSRRPPRSAEAIRQYPAPAVKPVFTPVALG
jgi:pimeloyl-ACP methyl ester carboxylesterase